ncbi:CPBP family intramembrane metalloprotease [Treponema sp. OMZ 840]|uniref:CPBP family glutamic-type intramembrane protease n=1 Tax=Treponema sp. OMZ 840 TaxID=244313 RepID=UPI003D8A45EC
MKFFHRVSIEILEYFLIIALCAVPSLFVSERKEPASLFPSADIIFFYATAAVFLLLRSKKSQTFKVRQSAVYKKGKKKCIMLFLHTPVYGLLCFCLLIASALLWNYIAKISGRAELPPVSLPRTYTERLLFFISAIVLASYEEIVFRFFLPERGLAIIHDIAPESEKSKSGFVLKAAAETIPIVLFALAHRYLGLFAVGNALCAAIILRLALYKKLHITLLCAVHAAYNITIFIALSCMRS